MFKFLKKIFKISIIVILFFIVCIILGLYAIQNNLSAGEVTQMSEYLAQNKKFFWSLRYTIFAICGLFWYLTWRNIVNFELTDARKPYIRITIVMLIFFGIYEISFWI